MRGARHFRAGQYDAALVEFRVAQRASSDDEAARYVGATLVKLQRFEEAFEAFARVQAPSDDLMRWYEAMACHGARLYQRAERLLATLATGGGPAVSAHARQVQGEVQQLLAGPPTEATLTWYRARAAEATDTGRPALAAAYLAEAEGLATRRRSDPSPGGRPVAAEAARPGAAPP